MNFYQELLEHLKTTFFEDSRIKSLKIGPPDKWSQQHFELLAELITLHLAETTLISKTQKLEIGQTISVSTLKRLFKYNYHIDQNLDKRQIKSLDKICLFLNIQGWKYFHQNYLKGIKNPTHGETIDVLRSALAAEFDCYLKMDAKSEDLLKEYFFEDGPALKKIKANIAKKKKQKLHLQNPLNPSSFELIDIQN